MGLRSIRLFNPDGTGTPFLTAQWQQKAALQPYQPRNPLVTREGMATAYFTAIWPIAFPTRDPLPKERLAEDDGRGTDEFWNVLA